MTERQRATPPANAARIAVAGVIIAGGALAMAGQAGADPAVPYPTPAPSDPAAAAPAPGQPVVESSDGPVGPPPPPPVGPPTVPEIPNPVYGQGQTPGQLGYLRDIWHTFHSGNPLDAHDRAAGSGARTAARSRSTAAAAARIRVTDGPGVLDAGNGARRGCSAGPPLPPGYYPLNGPPPPGIRLAHGARPGRATDGRTGSADALTRLGCVVSQRLAAESKRVVA